MISVIVIGKNEGERLGACLDSVKTAMGVMQHEVIYVDSHSTDDSLSIAAARGARCFLPEEKRTTAGLGRRIGTKEARGEYLLFLDGDMQLQQSFVQTAMMVMAQEGFDGATGIRDDIYLRGGKEIGRTENYFQCKSSRFVVEFGGALFIKKDALERAGGWSANTIACEEAELHARLKAASCRLVELPIPMILHTDAVRSNRGMLGTLFSRRRLGEGQAMRCAMAQKKASAYIAHEKLKFRNYGLDLLCILLLLILPSIGIVFTSYVQASQLGYFLAKRRARSFVSQKLFLLAFPAGLLTYRVRSEAYTGC